MTCAEQIIFSVKVVLFPLHFHSQVICTLFCSVRKAASKSLLFQEHVINLQTDASKQMKKLVFNIHISRHKPQPI